jgi:hypothetical protein
VLVCSELGNCDELRIHVNSDLKKVGENTNRSSARQENMECECCVFRKTSVVVEEDFLRSIILPSGKLRNGSGDITGRRNACDVALLVPSPSGRTDRVNHMGFQGDILNGVHEQS